MFERQKYMTYWEDEKKNVTDCKKDFKNMKTAYLTFKKCMVNPSFYLMKWKWQACSKCD